MSGFCCEHCGKLIIDKPQGQITATGCEHYPLERDQKDKRKKKSTLRG